LITNGRETLKPKPVVRFVVVGKNPGGKKVPDEPGTEVTGLRFGVMEELCLDPNPDRLVILYQKMKRGWL
jgi:hypothetical protein